MTSWTSASSLPSPRLSFRMFFREAVPKSTTIGAFSLSISLTCIFDTNVRVHTFRSSHYPPLRWRWQPQRQRLAVTVQVEALRQAQGCHKEIVIYSTADCTKLLWILPTATAGLNTLHQE